MKIRMSGIVVGLLIGIFLGGGTGIVGGGGGIAGVYVFSAIGAVIGFFAAPDIVRFFKRKK